MVSHIRKINMTNQNDDKILALQAQIREKKTEIGKIERFSPKTNCSISLDGERYNLNALDRTTCVYLLAKLSSLITAANKYTLANELVISGYSAHDWLGDLHAKYTSLVQKEKQQKLKTMETKLERLLSNEKRTELEIDEIRSLLEG